MTYQGLHDRCTLGGSTCRVELHETLCATEMKVLAPRNAWSRCINTGEIAEMKPKRVITAARRHSMSQGMNDRLHTELAWMSLIV